MPKKRFMGGWFISNHCTNRYKERVTDDPALNRGNRTTNDIERIIRKCLNEVDLSQTKIIKGAYFCPAQFVGRGATYYLLVAVDRPEKVITLVTEEMYQNSINGRNWKSDE